jgi:hypothetical protein
MQNNHIHLEKNSVMNRISTLEKQRSQLNEQMQEIYNNYVEVESSNLAIEYNSLVLQRNKIIRDINTFKRYLGSLHEDHKKIIHDNNKKRTKVMGVTVSILFIIFSIVALQSSVGITGFAATSAEVSAISNVSIVSNVAIQSNNLSAILFGELLPSTDANNATSNFNATGNSSAYIFASGNNSVDLDFCINATLLTAGTDTIPRNNYTFANGTTQDPANFTDAVVIPETFFKYAVNIPRSSTLYHRFWLDIPPQQAAGEYANNITFKAISTGAACE